MRVFYIFCFVLCMSVSAQEIYKTIKADGSVVYSDVPSDGAVPVNLSSNHSLLCQTGDDLTKAHQRKNHYRCTNVSNHKYQCLS